MALTSEQLLEKLRDGHHPHLAWLAQHSGPLGETLEVTYIAPLRQALVDELGITTALQFSILERAMASYRIAVQADYIWGEATTGGKVATGTLVKLTTVREQADRSYLHGIEYLRFLCRASAPSLRVVGAVPLSAQGIERHRRARDSRITSGDGPVRKVSSGGRSR